MLNRPLSDVEKQKMHPLELEVVQFYEQITKRPFMRSDLILLKQMIQVATPGQIKAIIVKMHKERPQSFQSFGYIYKPVVNIFSNRRGGKRR